MLAWCADAGAAAIPFGGGTSVCGGVEPRVGDELRRRGDDRPRPARPGARGRPGLARGAHPGRRRSARRSTRSSREHGLTLRHFPQSFEFSTLGGWIATRAGGHFATVWTHIDDLVESVRAITPAGAWESRRLPGSGAGPSPDRMLIGSEGILGVITEAWVRVHERPAHKASAAVAFADFAAGAEAVRALGAVRPQPVELPAARPDRGGGHRCRRLRPRGPGARLRVRPSARRPTLRPGPRTRPRLWRRGHVRETRREQTRDPAPQAAATRPGATPSSRRPTCATRWSPAACSPRPSRRAITWDRFEEFHATVTETAARAAGDEAKVMCRFTHVYPDGPAPYFTILAPARRGSEVEQWDEIKAAVSEALIAAGGTITHHHAVGRDHRPWYDRQRPDQFRHRAAGGQDRARSGSGAQSRRADRHLGPCKRRQQGC